jgi:hypothetical protein
MTERELKFFGMAAWLVNKGWESLVIAAYTEKDAKAIYLEIGGHQHGVHSHFKAHVHRAGTAFHAEVPNPSRGAYFGSRDWKSRMFVAPKSRSIIEEVPEEAKLAAAGQPIPEDYGRLRTGFSRGVKVDVWTYSSPHADRALGDQMTATVHLLPAARRARGGADGMMFVAESECFEKITSPNIETLFERVQAAFQTYELAQRGIVWADWMEISITPEHYGFRNEATSNGLAVGYSIIKRGVDPRNGNVYTINNNHVVTDFPKPKDAGEEDGGAKFHSRRSADNQYAYLPATVENVAAMNALLGKISELRERLAALLQQDAVGNELADISTGLLSFKGDQS